MRSHRTENPKDAASRNAVAPIRTRGKILVSTRFAQSTTDCGQSEAKLSTVMRSIL